MPAPKKVGTAVLAFPLDSPGERIGFWLRETGDKSQIQVGRDVLELAYREPKDYDANGPNGTFCSLG